MSNDIFAATGEPEADRVYLAQGGDWAQIAAEQAERGDETIVVNMGPQHPSTHGVLRLILEMDGETVTHIRPAIGFLHTGIEKNMEFKTWTQGVAFCTRMDYVAPLFNEAVYCLAVEKLLGITDDVPERASVLRVLVMELNRIASHLVAMGTGGMEIGALTVMTIAFREREMILDFLEGLTGLRMNHAYIRPGGVANDLQDGGLEHLRTVIAWLRKHLPEYATFCNENPIFKLRMQNLAKMDLTACMMMGVTGPILRSTGYEWDLRRAQPYCGYETYDFDIPVYHRSDCYNRLAVRFDECYQSLKIVSQCVDRLDEIAERGDDPSNTTMVADPTIAWPARMAIATDGQGQSLEHVREIMGTSMESLIHHFKLVTQGFRVPAGQVFTTVEHAKGVLGVHAVSDGGTRPYRVHFRDPSFSNLQSLAMMGEGGMIADLVPSLASIDPVLGGVDR